MRKPWPCWPLPALPSGPVTHAQNTIQWASPVDGNFGVAGNWFPSAVPDELDTTVLGCVGPDVVSTNRQTVADFDGDGDLTIFDFLAFQNAFDLGCP